MSADFLAALVGGVGSGLHLFDRHGHDVGGPVKPVTAGRVELDDVDALLDFLAHGLAELVSAVADTSEALHLELPPARMEIDGVAGGYDVAAAGNEARSRNHPLVDRALERHVNVVEGAGADRTGETGAQERFGVLRRDQRQHRGRMLHVELEHIADIVVGDVVVALHHPRHQRAPGEVVDDILGSGFGRVAVGADGGNAFAVDHDGRVLLGGFTPSIRLARRKNVRPIGVASCAGMRFELTVNLDFYPAGPLDCQSGPRRALTLSRRWRVAAPSVDHVPAPR